MSIRLEQNQIDDNSFSIPDRISLCIFVFFFLNFRIGYPVGNDTHERNQYIIFERLDHFQFHLQLSSCEREWFAHRLLSAHAMCVQSSDRASCTEHGIPSDKNGFSFLHFFSKCWSDYVKIRLSDISHMAGSYTRSNIPLLLTVFVIDFKTIPTVERFSHVMINGQPIHYLTWTNP